MKEKRKGCNPSPTEMNMESKKKLKNVNKSVDPQLWHAISGGMVQMPEVNSQIFYFPQGHAEHACEPVNFSAYSKIPSFIPCKVEAIKYMADRETDEVYAKLRLVPMHINQVSFDNDGVPVAPINVSETKDKHQSFAKTLTQSDANNGGGFSCPRYCAETLFPRLDYSGSPPFQDIYPKDVHGEKWHFRHVYRGTPKRHLLTTGWSPFVSDKKLASGDSIVFLRSENGDLHVGIRRAKRRNNVGVDPSLEWKSGSGIGICPAPPYGGFTSFTGEEDNKLRRNGKGNGLLISDGMMGRGKVKALEVIEAVKLGTNMQPFDVVYYPRSGTPEFFVKTSLIGISLQIRWCPGMRFKMAIETEDSSRISWFIGTVASVQAADPAWPDSLWRLLQVTWDETELLKNVKRVNPWQVEIVSNMPSIPLSPFVPPRKKLRFPEHPNFSLDCQFSMPTFPNNLLSLNIPIFHLPETTPAGMQGARHSHFDLSLPDFHLNKFPLGLFKPNFQPFNHTATTPMMVPNYSALQKPNPIENVSCSHSISTSTQSKEKPDHVKPHQLVLFGQTIHIDAGNENAEKKMTNHLYDLHLQGLLERSSGESLEWNPKNQFEETLAGETSEKKHSATSSEKLGG